MTLVEQLATLVARDEAVSRSRCELLEFVRSQSQSDIDPELQDTILCMVRDMEK